MANMKETRFQQVCVCVCVCSLESAFVLLGVTRTYMAK